MLGFMWFCVELPFMISSSTISTLSKGGRIPQSIISKPAQHKSCRLLCRHKRSDMLCHDIHEIGAGLHTGPPDMGRD